MGFFCFLIFATLPPALTIFPAQSAPNRINCPISTFAYCSKLISLGGIIMSDNCQQTVRCSPEDLRQALSIHTRKITDSCRDKDCIEDLRVYLTKPSQAILDTAAGAKVRCADLLYTYIDVEPVAFDRNHYCIDITFYYRILADATTGTCRCSPVSGLAVFSKRVVLCGEDSSAHIYTSETRLGQADGLTRISANIPTAVVEVTDTNSQNRKTNPYPIKNNTRASYLLNLGYNIIIT